MSDTSITVFPADEIDPKLKNELDYNKRCAESIYNDWQFVIPRTMFAHNALEYEINKSYALGYQDINRYKPMMGVDASATDSNLLIDWSVRNIVGKFRRIALGKINQIKYNLEFRPVDATAKDEMSKYYSDQKAAILMRQSLAQQAPQLLHAPSLKKRHGDPDDLEEMEMQMDYGSKINISVDAEEGVQVVFQDEDNNFAEFCKQVDADYFDEDVAGFKTWIDENGRVRFRKTDLRNIVTNFVRKRDFIDLTKVGEIIQVELSELAKHFSDEDMEQIKNAANSNQQFSKFDATPGFYIKDRDKSKLYVFDCQWKTYNTNVKEQSIDPSGNLALANTKFSNRKSDKKIKVKGVEQPKYISNVVETNNGCKWIIGTEFAYEYGPCKNQPRSTDKRKAARTKLDYEFYAADMHEMRTNSIMKQLRPMADEYQLLVYKIQNLNNRLMPFGWAIDLDAIEDVALGNGGKKMSPEEVLDMFFQGQLLVYRKKDLDRNNVNYKPIEAIQTSFAQEMVSLYNHMASIVAQIRDISGLNEVTDGSTAGQDRMPNPLIEANQESANNSLFSIIDARKKLTQKLGMSCFRKLQIALKAGDYAGYIQAIGTNSMKAIVVAPSLVDREMALTCEEMPTDEKKQMLMQLMQEDIKNGFLDASDVLIIIDMYSIKKAYQILSYRVKKNKQLLQQNALQQSQQNGQVQMQSAGMAEQAKQQTAAMQHAFDMEYLNREIEGNIAVQEVKNKSADSAEIIGAKTQIMVKAMDVAAAANDGDGSDSEGAGDNDAAQGLSQGQPAPQPAQTQQVQPAGQ